MSGAVFLNTVLGLDTPPMFMEPSLSLVKRPGLFHTNTCLLGDQWTLVSRIQLCIYIYPTRRHFHRTFGSASEVQRKETTIKLLRSFRALLSRFFPLSRSLPLFTFFLPNFFFQISTFIKNERKWHMPALAFFFLFDFQKFKYVLN